MLGTPDYIAPEQIRNAQSADIRADVYSLGCTFYAEIRGRKIGDTFPDQSSIFPVFFPGSSGRLSLVFPLI
jgi:serine/threonine protein kinase